MAQDRTTNDRKIRIGAEKIMREQLYKIKKLYKCIAFYFHRAVLTVEHYAMFIIIHIR